MARTLSLRPWLLALAALALVGCETLQQTPKVEFPDPATQRPVAIAPQPAHVATGGLYSQVRYRPLFEDRRPRMVGDTLTVQIVENLNASQTSTASVDKSGSVSSGISAFPFLSANRLGKLNVGAESENTFAGSGGTSAANTFSGTITTTVVDVLPNGHLAVLGEKQIGVNQNVDVLRFSGTIDPRALQPGSIVNSTQVANVRVESRGRGAQSEAQAMGWMNRFFNTITPF
jgi:flagellar L-ring protein precursor FlgH